MREIKRNYIVKKAIIAATYAVLTMILVPISYGPVQLKALVGMEDNKYSEMMGLIIHHERGDFENVNNLLIDFDLTIGTMNNEYFNAIQWNSEINKEIN